MGREVRQRCGSERRSSKLRLCEQHLPTKEQIVDQDQDQNFIEWEHLTEQEQDHEEQQLDIEDLITLNEQEQN